jgi:hypothetical protein
MIRIENWAVVGLPIDPYKPPEQGVILVLKGQVYGHPKFPDGSELVTSPIMHADGRCVATVNHDYLLGTVELQYKDWYEKHEGKSFNEDDHFAVVED